jgi:uncharacterized protein YecE (DUF72 family)
MAIHVGTCSWTEKTLIESGEFYPRTAVTAEAKLRYYAENFNTVEVDSTYYAIPPVGNSLAWAQRTPDNFIFHIKVYGALTQHSIDPLTLPGDLRDMLTRADMESKRVYVKDASLLKEIAVHFRESLYPLMTRGKLGILVFQFPPWFRYSEENKDYILKCKEMFAGLKIAVEFRHGSWFSPEKEDAVFDLLRKSQITYVVADEPQFGDQSTVPFVPALTADTAYFRFHGRNKENWTKKNIATALRYAYHYSDEELKEFVPAIKNISRRAKEVYLMYNNCYGSYAVKNAIRTKLILNQD